MFAVARPDVRTARLEIRFRTLRTPHSPAAFSVFGNARGTDGDDSQEARLPAPGSGGRRSRRPRRRASDRRSGRGLRPVGGGAGQDRARHQRGKPTGAGPGPGPEKGPPARRGAWRRPPARPDIVGLPPTIVERAFTLCRNGEARSWPSLRRRLSREGFDPDHPALRQQQHRILDAMGRAAGEGGTPGSPSAPGRPRCSRNHHLSMEGPHGR